MADNKVDGILLEIEATTDKADGGIDKMIKCLSSMKKITEGMDKEKLEQIRKTMKDFSELGDSLKNTGTGMRSIASSIRSMNGISTSKLNKIATTMKEVGNALSNIGSNNKISIKIDSEGIKKVAKPLEEVQQAQTVMDEASSTAVNYSKEEEKMGESGRSAASGQNALNDSVNNFNASGTNAKIQSLIKQINQYKATIRGMESGKVMFDTSQYEEAVNGLRQAQEQFKQFKADITNTPKNMEDVSKSLASIGDVARKCGFETVSSILTNIAAILPNIEIGGIAAGAGFQSMAAGLQAVQSAIPIIGIILTVLTKIINLVNQAAAAVKNSVQKIITSAKNVANKVCSAVQSIINKFKELKKKVREGLGFSEKQTGSFAKKLHSITRLFTFMILRTAIRQLFDLVVNKFNNLVIYSRKIGSEFHKNVNLLYNDLQQLGNSMIAAFEPVLNAVAPILDYLIQKLIAATNALAQFFSALTGKSFYTKAIKQNKDYASSLSSAAKAAKNLTLGIDELNIISESSGGGGSSGIDGSGFEENPIVETYKNIADLIKAAWENADFYKIGRMIGEKLNKALESIRWGGIKAALRKIAKSIATFLNGFLETPGLFTVIGQTIAEGINSSFEFVDSFVQNFHWGSLGKAISDLIIGALGKLNWSLIKRTVKGIAQGIVDALNAAFQTEDLWKKIGTAFSNTVNSAILFAKTFVTDLDWASLGNAIGELLGNTIANIDYEDIGKTFAGFVNEIFETVLNFSETFPWIEIATNFANGINTALKNFDWTTIKEGFNKFCSGLGSNLNTAITNIDWGLVGTTFGNCINALFSGVGEFLAKIDFKQIGSDIATAINYAVKSINWKEAGGTINSLITGVCTLINTLIDEVDWFALMGGVTQAIAELDWDTLLATVFRAFAARWTFTNMFKGVSWITIFTELKNSIVEGISNVFNVGNDDGEINTIGENIVSGLLDGISKACMPSFIEKPLSVFENVTNFVKAIFGVHSPSTVFAEIGTNIVAGFINGITEKFADCQRKITEWANKIKEWFTSSCSYSKFYDIAADVINGFKNGIGALATTCKSAIESWASNIISWFKGKLDSHSPSKVFLRIGKDAVEGFNIGVNDEGKTTKGIISSWADSFSDIDINLGTRLRINDSAFRDYQINYGSDFSNEVIVQRVKREIATSGAVQATLNSGGGLKEAVKEALEELGISSLVENIAQNTRETADKDFSVNIGDREISRANDRGRAERGYVLIT